MNIVRIILDGIAMSFVFNMTVGMFWFIMPHAYSIMLPKEIKEKAGDVSKKERLHLAMWLYPLYIGIIIWISLSIKTSGITGFWNIFWTSYIEWLFVNFGDFIILDCFLRSFVKDKNLIANTSQCKTWNIKEWMKSAIPEHFIFWPLIICPLVSLLIAFIIK